MTHRGAIMGFSFKPGLPASSTSLLRAKSFPAAGKRQVWWRGGTGTWRVKAPPPAGDLYGMGSCEVAHTPPAHPPHWRQGGQEQKGGGVFGSAPGAPCQLLPWLQRGYLCWLRSPRKRRGQSRISQGCWILLTALAGDETKKKPGGGRERERLLLPSLSISAEATPWSLPLLPASYLSLQSSLPQLRILGRC